LVTDSGADSPRAGVHDDALRRHVGRKLILQGMDDLFMPSLRKLAGLAVDLARRANCKLEGDRVIDGAAHHDRRVDALEREPAISSCLVTVALSAMVKGPGPQVSASSPGRGRNRKTTCFGRFMQGLSSSNRHTIIVIVPPYFNALRMLRRPATGFWKNCVPKREKQASCTGSNR
jgi:hypothetical protein